MYPIMLPIICSRTQVLVKLTSVIGPVQTKMVFNIVRFVADVILRVDTSLVTRVRPSAESTPKMIAVNSGGGCANTINEGNKSGGSPWLSGWFDTNSLLTAAWLESAFFICWSGLTKLDNEDVSICHYASRLKYRYLGIRWRGQGTNPKSWGQLNRKLKIWGKKKSNKVLLKWPKIPTTAKAIPQK